MVDCEMMKNNHQPSHLTIYHHLIPSETILNFVPSERWNGLKETEATPEK